MANTYCRCNSLEPWVVLEHWIDHRLFPIRQVGGRPPRDWLEVGIAKSGVDFVAVCRKCNRRPLIDRGRSTSPRHCLCRQRGFRKAVEVRKKNFECGPGSPQTSAPPIRRQPGQRPYCDHQENRKSVVGCDHLRCTRMGYHCQPLG